MPNDVRNASRLIATILLAVAAVATAWATYQSTQWRGELTLHGASRQRPAFESSTASTHGGQLATSRHRDLHPVGRRDRSRQGTRSLTSTAQRFRDRVQARVRRLARDRSRSRTPTPPAPPSSMPEYQVAETTEATRLNWRRPSRIQLRASDSHRPLGQLHAGGRALRGLAVLRGHLDQAPVRRDQREAVLALGVLLFLGTFIWIATLPAKFFG